MEGISNFITTLVTTLILMTAVELITPDNSTKKYINFVLGLILISVMLTPIMSFFSKGQTKIINEISKYENNFKEVIKNDGKDEVDINRSKDFKKNLDENCNKLLENKFTTQEFESDISCNMDIENMAYSIDKVMVGVKDIGIKKIQKVEINKNTSSEVIASKNGDDLISGREEIINYLGEILKVKAEKIELYTIKQ